MPLALPAAKGTGSSKRSQVNRPTALSYVTCFAEGQTCVLLEEYVLK